MERVGGPAAGKHGRHVHRLLQPRVQPRHRALRRRFHRRLLLLHDRLHPPLQGVTPVEPVKEIHQIAVDGKFDDWTALGTRYKDYKGDTRARNHWGFGYKNISLTNNTGRNDICYAKVATDCKSLFFYVETADPITPRTDRNWMRLFISVKGSTAPAWEGFQWVVNNRVVSENRTTLQRSKGGWDWEEAATVDYAVSGNRMEIAVPLSQLGITDARDFTVDFKWIDKRRRRRLTSSECMRDGRFGPGRALPLPLHL